MHGSGKELINISFLGMAINCYKLLREWVLLLYCQQYLQSLGVM